MSNIKYNPQLYTTIFQVMIYTITAQGEPPQ